ncbi:hypothetical protein [Brachyspira sp. G79]|uniref:hypothetical protein n=1 Tax=Brachyspira sp. G79 TaxID=1358104 RepID=UPI000BBB981A|nr:hypothetical protein [Brachyspira sp. G79]PCG20595.1 hypothetical protein KQ44_11765 [Brachyspira sp. G79]
MPRISASAVFDKRLSRVENKIGINEDGTLNGNGFINTINEIKEQLKSHEIYLNNITSDMIKIDHRLEKLETLVKETNKERVSLIYESNEEQKRIIEDIKDIKKHLDDSVTGTKILKYMKILITIAGTITALGSIITALYFFTNKFMG